MKLKEKLSGIEKEIDYFPSFDFTGGHSNFVVYCDSSRVCLVYAVLKNGKVIEYAFIQLKFYEKNHPSHDLKLSILVLLWKCGVIICMVFMLMYSLIRRDSNMCELIKILILEKWGG